MFWFQCVLYTELRSWDERKGKFSNRHRNSFLVRSKGIERTRQRKVESDRCEYASSLPTLSPLLHFCIGCQMMYSITNVRIIFVACTCTVCYLFRGIYICVPINTIFNLKKDCFRFRPVFFIVAASSFRYLVHEFGECEWSVINVRHFSYL